MRSVMKFRSILIGFLGQADHRANNLQDLQIVQLTEGLRIDSVKKFCLIDVASWAERQMDYCYR